MWSEGVQGGCTYANCPWTIVDTCWDGSPEVEQQFIDVCDECGDCKCSGSLNSRTRENQCPPPPAAPSSGDDPSNGGDDAKSSGVTPEQIDNYQREETEDPIA